MEDVKSKIPEIRFEGFTDAWEQRKLGELIVDYLEKTTRQNQYPVLTSSQKQGIVLQEDYFSNRQVTTDNNVGYFVLPRGYYTYRSRSDNSIFIFNRNDIIDRGIISYFYPVFSLRNTDSEFFLRRINNGIQKQVSIAAEGTGQHVLSLKKFKNITTNFPIIEEQTKLGNFFKKLDKTITFQERELELLKEQKKGFLQKIFPRNDEKVPELRFEGFTDAWEQRKFKNLVATIDGIRRGPFGSALKKEFFVENSEYVVYEQQNAIYDRYDTRYNITEEKYEELIKFKVSPGDFIMSGAGTIGRISLVPKGITNGVFNQALIRFKLNEEETDSKYFLQLMRSENMQRMLTGSNPGSAMVNLVPMSEVKEWNIMVPCLNEQKLLGNFFTNLDKTITLQERKLESMKEMKKSFLQKMFV